MAKLNAAKAIENGRKCTPIGYTMTLGTLRLIYERNNGNAFDMVSDSFYLGVAQGMKIAKAKMKKWGVAIWMN